MKSTARRPHGRDLVVVALVVLSCGGREVKSSGTRTVAEKQGARHARIDRTDEIVRDRAGCERCAASDVETHVCTLRLLDPPVAVVGVPCASAMDLEMDPEGRRVAVHDRERSTATVYVAGPGARLIEAKAKADGGAPARTVGGRIDWSAIPGPTQLLEDTYRIHAAAEVARGPSGEAPAGALAELRSLDPEGFAERLVRLVRADVGFDLCSFPDTAWMRAVRALDERGAANVVGRLSGVLPARAANERIAALLPPAAVLALGTKPETFLATHRAAVDAPLGARFLGAWSRAAPAAASAAGCALLADRALPVELERAALLAVAGSTVPCRTIDGSHLHELACVQGFELRRLAAPGDDADPPLEAGVSPIPPALASMIDQSEKDGEVVFACRGDVAALAIVAGPHAPPDAVAAAAVAKLQERGRYTTTRAPTGSRACSFGARGCEVPVTATRKILRDPATGTRCQVTVEDAVRSYTATALGPLDGGLDDVPDAPPPR